MIQRIQTLLLALVIILGIAFSFIPLLEYNVNDSTYMMNAYKTINLNDGSVIAKNMGVGVMQGIVFLVAIATIFLYKNRSLQIKIGKLIILLIAVQIVAVVMYNDATKTVIGNMDAIKVSFKLGSIIPVVSLILTYLAIYFIKKDEKLIRSADRLR